VFVTRAALSIWISVFLLLFDSSQVWAAPAALADAALHSAALGVLPAASDSPTARLSPLERRLVERAIAAYDLELVRFPEGHVIGEIVVDNFDVFLDDDLFPLIFNWLHVTTSPDIVRRRLTFAPGERFDRVTVDESRRLVLDPMIFSTVVTVPVRRRDRSPNGGHDGDDVDLLVVTKDLWSLRFNSNFQTTGAHRDYFAASLSENNFLGLNKTVALAFLLEPDVYSFGPTYLDSQVLGSRLTLEERVKFSFNRDTSAFEGAYGSVSVGQPLYSVRNRWAWSLGADFLHLIARQHSAGQELRYPFDAAEGEETMPWEFRDRLLEVQGSVTRSVDGHGFGDALIKHNFSWGWRVLVRDPTVIDAQRYSPELVSEFQDMAMPSSHRQSYPFVSYHTYEPTYRTYFDVETLGLGEDLRLGHDFVATVGMGHPFTGSETTFLAASTQATTALRLAGDDRLSAVSLLRGRLERGQWIDTVSSSILRYVSPVLGIGRLHLAGIFEMRFDDSDNNYNSIGGDSGLRGYASAQFYGKNVIRGNVEYRTQGLELWSTWLGMNVFWDVGDAFDGEGVGGIGLHNGLGLGLRWLVPQLNRVVIRLDWASPIDSPAPFPGRVNLGFEQAF